MRIDIRSVVQRHPVVVVILFALAAAAAMLACAALQMFGKDSREAFRHGAFDLVLAGLLGGGLKLLLDEIAASRRRLEDAAGFVANVLSDLKHAYDGVASARVFVAARRTIGAYDEAMRDVIQARVQLRNVDRALKLRAAGVDRGTRLKVRAATRWMGRYLDALTAEYVAHYKALSDLDRCEEARRAALVARHGEANEGESPPPLPDAALRLLDALPALRGFLAGATFESRFGTWLDVASVALRDEHALILRGVHRDDRPLALRQEIARAGDDRPTDRNPGRPRQWRMDYLHFDVSDNADGILTLEALASTPADRHAAVLAEVQQVLDWARARFPHTHGRADDGMDWDHDLQDSVEPGGWHAVTLTITASERFADEFLAEFGEQDN